MISNFSKGSICFILFLSSLVSSASQEPIKVVLNETNNITLFFPSEIANVVAPSGNFHFSYDKQSNMGVLNTSKGAKLSNLTVTTNDGYIFSFVLIYANEISNFVFVLTQENAIGLLNGAVKKKTVVLQETKEEQLVEEIVLKEIPTENIASPVTKETVIETTPEVKKNETSVAEKLLDTSSYLNIENTTENNFTSFEPELDLYQSDPETYYQVFCENNYLQKPVINNISNKVGVIELIVDNISVDKNEIYFTLQITNESLKGYYMNDIKFYVKNRGSENEFLKEPLYTYNTKNVLEPNTSFNAVYVFKDFKLTADQHLYILLDGFDGNRFLMLPLTAEVVNRVAL